MYTIVDPTFLNIKGALSGWSLHGHVNVVVTKIKEDIRYRLPLT